jgi:hypothetical protein
MNLKNYVLRANIDASDFGIFFSLDTFLLKVQFYIGTVINQSK